MVKRRLVRGFPSRRHAAIWSWNAASKGATSASNSSRVKLVRLRNSAGRACTSANRTPVMDRASCQGTVLSQTHHIANRDKIKHLRVEPVGLGAAVLARDGDTGGVDDVRFHGPVRAASGRARTRPGQPRRRRRYDGHDAWPFPPPLASGKEA